MQHDENRRDRAQGALLGLAIGDAVGTTLEFKRRDSYAPLDDMIGGGPFGLAAGQWTDDTSMALCLADSLLARGDIDEHDLMQRFVRWWRDGENSPTGKCFDIGTTTREALGRFVSSGNPVAGDTGERTAGNGSIMRLAPVALFWQRDGARARTAARRQGSTTHRHPATLDACDWLAASLVEAVRTGSRDAALAMDTPVSTPEIASVLAGSWRTKRRAEISSSGYVAHTLEAALWAVGHASDFRDAVLRAVNLGDDADSVGAVAGQLAGAIWGAAAIPPEWRRRLAWHAHIKALADALYERAAAMP